MRVRGSAIVVLGAALVLAGCTQAPLPDGVGTSAPPASPRSTLRPGSASSAASSPQAQATTTSAAASAGAPAFGDTATGHPIVVLNPGHNGGDAAAVDQMSRLVPAGFGEYKACDTTGTETNLDGYPEHAFNWDVTLRARAILQTHGVTVRLTRDSDTGVGPCVDERARIGNQAGVVAVVSIHADGGPVDGHGFHVEECSQQPAGPVVAALSHSLTVAEHDALAAGSGLTVSSYLGTDGYLPRNDLAGLNLATVPATFLEIGNMRNEADAAIQSSPDGRQRIAQAVANGILSWLATR